MPSVKVDADARVAELVVLDVLDVLPDGSLALNDAFRALAVASYEAREVELDDVFQTLILARARERGFAVLVDVDGLALTALEVAVNEAERNAEA